MCLSRFIAEPSAIVGGSAAYLLSRWLRTPSARTSMRAAQWLHGPDVTAALAAIHEAGRAWAELRERNDVIRCELPDPNRATLTVEEASERLGVGKRRVQQLTHAGRITGRRVGCRWVLDSTSVRAYQQQHAEKSRISNVIRASRRRDFL
jgi:excisionase family DNA binding protein